MEKFYNYVSTYHTRRILSNLLRRCIISRSSLRASGATKRTYCSELPTIAHTDGILYHIISVFLSFETKHWLTSSSTCSKLEIATYVRHDSSIFISFIQEQCDVSILPHIFLSNSATRHGIFMAEARNSFFEHQYQYIFVAASAGASLPAFSRNESSSY